MTRGLTGSEGPAMQKLIDQLATGESPAEDGYFDPEIEVMLARLENQATAANIRSIARQLAAANTAHTRGYVTGYLDGVRQRLGVPSAEVRKASAVAFVDSLHVGQQPPTIDPSVAERFLDAAYTALDEWSSNPAGGREALGALDGALAALQDARRQLVEEIEQDDVEERELKPVVEVEHEGYALGGRGETAAEVTE